MELNGPPVSLCTKLTPSIPSKPLCPSSTQFILTVSFSFGSLQASLLLSLFFATIVHFFCEVSRSKIDQELKRKTIQTNPSNFFWARMMIGPRLGMIMMDQATSGIQCRIFKVDHEGKLLEGLTEKNLSIENFFWNFDKKIFQ